MAKVTLSMAIVSGTVEQVNAQKAQAEKLGVKLFDFGANETCDVHMVTRCGELNAKARANGTPLMAIYRCNDNTMRIAPIRQNKTGASGTPTSNGPFMASDVVADVQWAFSWLASGTNAQRDTPLKIMSKEALDLNGETLTVKLHNGQVFTLTAKLVEPVKPAIKK